MTVAENNGGPRYHDELFKYELVTELKEDAREESMLFRPNGFAMDERGFFFVDDYGNHRIAVFDPDGKYVYSMGREGEGPGEFRRLISITEIRGDTLIIQEKAQYRITRYRTDGTLIDVIRVRPPTPYVRFSYAINSSSYLSICNEQYSTPDNVTTFRPFVVIHSAAGDTLAHYSNPWIETHYLIEGTRSMRQYLLGPFPGAAFRRDYGWIITNGDSPVLNVRGFDGSTNLRIELNLPEVAVLNEDIRIQKDFISLEMQRADSLGTAAGIDKEQIDAWVQRLGLERSDVRSREYRGFWQSIEIDDNNHIWLEVPEHALPKEQAGGGKRYMLISPEGEYLGMTRRPRSLSSTVQHGHLLATVSNDSDGSRRMISYRIVPAVAGLEYP